ncbi:flagellar basal body P-ring formation chaperone FlgA [Pseudomonas sp. Q1-7]|uniref:flagellar basal body P-ring formation chaperone FlgA n=1 Tax=Pseudomonas sp. Q1-7 TaxID=3020843 RepID=UPI00230118D8|nr:flagellar basal body P-ring formation chaperone FlgA [Pseudomonas sp. Q1-7]
MARRCGKAASAFFLLACVGFAQAADDARRQVEQAVAAYQDASLQQEAQRQGWTGMRHSLDNQLLGSAASLSPCPATPVVRAPVGGDPLTRQRLQVSCPPGQPGWPVTVLSTPRLALPMLVATGVIARGQALSATQLALQTQELGKARQGFYQDPAEVAGMTAKRRIRANQLLTPALLAGALLVRRSQKVTIQASHEGIVAATQGEALADGRNGDVIRVKNTGSQKHIDAKVIGNGVVSSTFDRR